MTSVRIEWVGEMWAFIRSSLRLSSWARERQVDDDEMWAI
jgi:hypothetical protein